MKTKNIPYRCQCGEMRADRICERCGASLCEKCSVVIEREEESKSCCLSIMQGVGVNGL
jgi:hypothetical protein